MSLSAWYEDPSADCAHARTTNDVVELTSGRTYSERCLDCRAVRLTVPSAPVLRVVYRAEPLVTRRAPFPTAAPVKAAPKPAPPRPAAPNGPGGYQPIGSGPWRAA